MTEKWQYGWLLFLSTAHVENGRPNFRNHGPKIAVLRLSTGDKLEESFGRELELMDRLGAEGWIIEAPVAISQSAKIFDDELASRGLVSLAYFQHYMRRRI